MIVVSNLTDQTLQPGQSLVFDRLVQKSGNGECFRLGSNFIKLRGKLYELSFSGNIGGVAQGPAQVSIQVGGSTLTETTAISQTAAAGDLNSVSKDTAYGNCCCDFDRVTITNTGTAAITVGAGFILKAVRKA